MSDRFKLLFATIVYYALLTSPALLAQETPPAANAPDPKATRPTLNELMVKFAEIEKSYLPFHVRYRQTYGRPHVLAETDSEAAKLHYDSKYEMIEIGQMEKQVWFMNTERFSDGVSAGTESHRSNMNGVYNIFSGEGELRTNSFTFHDEDPENHDYVRSLLLAGVFPVRMFQPETGMLMSDYFQKDPSRIRLSWDGELAKLEFELQSSAPSPNQNESLHDDAIDTPQFCPLERFQLWLDPAQKWHPSRLRRSLFSTPEVLIEEWRVTKFIQDSGVPRILEASLGKYESDPTVNIIVEESEFGAEVDADLFPANEFLHQKGTAAGGAKDTLVPSMSDDDVEMNEITKSQITSLREEIEKLKEFNQLVNKFNDLMKQRRFAEAELIAKLANELQTNDAQVLVQASIMVEKARLHRQAAFNESIHRRKETGDEDGDSPREIIVDADQIKIFNLKNSNATDAAQILRQLFNDVTVSLDNRTNALIVRATELQLHEIEAVLLRLDSTETAVKNSETTNQPANDANTPVTSIAEYRRQLDALEQPVLQLAEQVRASETKHGKDHPDSEKLRADLRALVQQTFAARQEIQRAELAEFTRRLHRMQQSIDARDRIADKVIDRRLEELLDPNVAWTQRSTLFVQPESTSPIQPPEQMNSSDVSEEKQIVSVTLFAVKDDASLQQIINANPSEQQGVARYYFKKQLSNMLKDGTATVLGKHTIETRLNETATVHIRSGFDGPSTDPQSKTRVDFGTRIQIVPQLVDGERVFDIVWNERISDMKSGFFEFPIIKELQTHVVLKSPQAGVPGYIVGPVHELQNNYRKFIHFFLRDAASASSTADSKQEQDAGPSEGPDMTASPTPPSEISVVDGSLTADADAAAASERAEAVLVDLKPYYSAVAKDFEKATRFPWKWVPRGPQTFANVPLDIGGRICLWGERNANVNGQVFPEKVEGIAIDQEFETLFVYHCTFFESPQGTPVYELTFKYEDNTSASDTIRYLDDVRDWYCYPGEKQHGPTSDRSALAWHGATIIENGANPGDIQSLRFCLTAIENPHPDRKVKSIDLVSSKNQSAGCILAMTLGRSTLMRRTEPEPE